MAWYKHDLDKILDFEKVGNDFIESCKNDDRAKSYGNRFYKNYLRQEAKI